MIYRIKMRFVCSSVPPIFQRKTIYGAQTHKIYQIKANPSVGVVMPS